MGRWGPRAVRKVLSVGEAWYELLGPRGGECDIYSLASRMGPVIFQ